MSSVKLSPNQHVGYLEMRRYRSFTETKYNNIFKNFISNFGVFKNLTIDPSWNNLKIVSGTGTGKYTLKAGYAVDSDFNLIVVPSDIIDAYDVSALSGTQHACIEYDTRVFEEGTLSISTAGVLTGTGTKFTEVLRGQPHHATKIKFTNAVSNLAEYEVLSVTSDTSVTLQGGPFTAESNLRYKVVGTFTPGVVIPGGDKDIYSYDSALLSVKAGASPVLVAGKQFLLAVLPTGVGTPTDERASYQLALI
jgi:hypothetical protein